MSCDLEKGECCDPDGRGISLEQSWPTWVDGLLRRSTMFRDTEIVPQAAVLQLERRNGPRQHRRKHPHPPESKHPALSSMAAATFSPHEIGSDKVSDQRKGDRNHLLAISLFLVGNRISVRHMGISLKLSGTDHKNCRPQTSSQKGFSHETKFRPMGQKQKDHEMNRRSPWSYFSFPSYLHEQCWELQKKEEHTLKMVKQHQEPRAQEEPSGQLWMAGCWFFT